MHVLKAIALAAALQLAAVSPGAAQDAAAEGERQFKARCASCHSADPDQNRLGPHLSQVIGRPAGSVEGARYSAALRDSGIVWDERELDAYLANPRQAVPGTTMPVGLPSPAQRAQVIDYLRTLSGRAG